MSSWGTDCALPINVDLQRIIDQQTEPWSVKVTTLEVKNVDLPQVMQRTIARQAEAERERRAKVIHAEGELVPSQCLADAADVFGRNPVVLQLRYLQALVEIPAEKYSTMIFPISHRYDRPFLKWLIRKSLWRLGLLPYTHTYTPAARLPHRLSDFLIKAL